MLVHNKYIKLLIILIIVFVTSSCVDDKNNDEEEYYGETEQTVFLYMPWSNLAYYFRNNLYDLRSAMSENIIGKDRVIIFFAESNSKASLFEYKYRKGKVITDTIKNFDVTAFITPEGIAGLIDEVKEIAPAKSYSMIVSAHGMAWLPKEQSKARSAEKEYWENSSPYITKSLSSEFYEIDTDLDYKTKYFGGISEEYQINIEDYAEGVKLSNTKFNYLLFDACYLSSIEVVYELKDIADYIIASPTEIMGSGYPYKIIGKHLFGKPNYKAICDGFLSFYENYVMPYGTIAVVDCSEVDNMAQVMKSINKDFEFDTSKRGNIQRLDGYNPIRFYDFGDYVYNLCGDDKVFETFNSQINKMIPFRLSTKYYYSSSLVNPVLIESYSGINTSEPSNSSSTSTFKNTSWYKATH